MKDEIKKIILDYCEGNYHYEFSDCDFPEMLERIEKVKIKK